MNTCSNCGAAVRPGAKFCTACGTRLNDVSASTASSEWTSGQPGVSGVPNVAGAPSDTDASPAADRAHVDPPAANESNSSDTAPAPSTSEEAPQEASSSWSWRSSSRDQESPTSEPGDGEDVTTEPSSSEEPRVFIVDKRDDASPSPSTPSSTTNADASTEEFTWTWGTPDSPDATADDRTETSITDAERDAANRVAAEDAPLATEPGSEPPDTVRHDQEESFSLPEDTWSSTSAPTNEPNVTTSGDVSREATPGVDDESDLALEVDTLQAVDPASGSKRGNDTVDATEEPIAGGEDPLDRARRLVEELRTLIPPPRLNQEEAPRAVSAPVEELREELESARSTSDFGDLRSALESARERPRDVDTMLEMVGRVDTMLEALDDRDRLAAAVDRAIDHLGSDASASPR